MKIPIHEALSVTQMIIPEVDLGIHHVGGEVEIKAVPLTDWGYYINAMENASDLLLHELSSLPDVKPVTEIEAIAQDLNCLISSLSMFYACAINELKKVTTQYEDRDVNDTTFKRFSKYRTTINRSIKRGKIDD